MADELDMASDVEMHLTNCAVQTVRNSLRAVQFNDHEFCIDCDNEILLARRQIVKGCIRCASCQEKYEYKQRTVYGGR